MIAQPPYPHGPVEQALEARVLVGDRRPAKFGRISDQVPVPLAAICDRDVAGYVCFVWPPGHVRDGVNVIFEEL